jgi:hypothetical protein
LPEVSHASNPDLASLRSEIPADRFRGVTEGLRQTEHVKTLEDLALYAGISEASLRGLVHSPTASDGATGLRLTPLGEEYARRLRSEDGAARSYTTADRSGQSLADELGDVQLNRKR